ncbi:MAG: 2-phosphosulfolactate phosphatase [Cyclobacteriaceae bacterium]|nr:2-phosphosulfolactate phosphatase [Cyclobacteriaceae bacterium]MCH8516198.1 2-phosphosulfolactate phosphatase [Cyclobacteriaceae bacterium]
MKKASISCIYTPELIHQAQLEGKIAVVIDILRATSCMVAGLGAGVPAIRPFLEVATCRSFRDQGYLLAGERNGEKLEGFDLGNSPLEYESAAASGKKIAVTTTNGTRSLAAVAAADQILVGAFLNQSALIEYLANQSKDIVILCAGWKGTVNAEDTLFAGALVHGLQSTHTAQDDASLMAKLLYQSQKGSIAAFLSSTSHAKRLSGLNSDLDIELCGSQDKYSVVPILIEDEIVRKD